MRRRRRRLLLRRRTRRAPAAPGRAQARQPPVRDGDDDGEVEPREELERLIADVVRVHLPAVDEATARHAGTVLRALAAGVRPGRADASAGRERRRRAGRRRERHALRDALLVVAVAAVGYLALARMVFPLLHY